jgi:hypothetical protein
MQIRINFDGSALRLLQRRNRENQCRDTAGPVQRLAEEEDLTLRHDERLIDSTNAGDVGIIALLRSI